MQVQPYSASESYSADASMNGAAQPSDAQVTHNGETAPNAPRAPESTSPENTLREMLTALSIRLRLRGSELEAATELSGRELDLIALLSLSGPTSVKSLVADLGLPRSTMTAIVDRLEERELVIRRPNPADRRSIILEATPKAGEAFARYNQAVSAFLDQLGRSLSPDEQNAFRHLVEKVSKTV